MKGNQAGDSASAMFTVTGPMITLTPSSGPIGAPVSITGSGFATSDVCPVVITSSPSGLIGALAAWTLMAGGVLSAAGFTVGPGALPGIYL